MTRKALTSKEIATFRQTYCEAAYNLYLSQDINAISMRGIAKHMGCSPMMAYRYFENKDEVFSALRTMLFHKLADRLEAQPMVFPATQYLRKLGQAYVDFALNEPDAYRLLYMTWLAPQSANTELQVSQSRTREALLKATRGVVESGEMRGDPITIAYGMWGLVHGIISLHLNNQFEPGEMVKKRINDVFEQFIQTQNS